MDICCMVPRHLDTYLIYCADYLFQTCFIGGYGLANQRFYAGCRWIFNPFTEGYAEIRTYIVPCKYQCVGKYPQLTWEPVCEIL